MKKFILLMILPLFCFGQNRESIYDAFTKYDSTPNFTYVVDGERFELEDLKNLYSDEIESVSILRNRCPKDQLGPHLCGDSINTIIITTKNSIPVYNLIVTDLGFDSFLAQQESEGTYSLEFLKSRNQRYVKRWNQKVGTGNPDIFDMRIDYSSQNKYDLALEYKLYQFFRFIEHKYKLRLI